MKLQLEIDGAQDSIDLVSTAPDCRFRMGSGPEREAQVEEAEPGVYSILMDGRSYEARVEEQPAGGVVVVIDGQRFEIEVRDPRRLARKTAGRGADGVQSLTAPMPGKVVRVLVVSGDQVEAGQGLLVVEAMKMQNEIRAARAGTVLSLPAKEGAAVRAGEVLATVG